MARTSASPSPAPPSCRERGIIHPEKGLENPLAERFRDAGSLVGNHDLEPFPIPVARDVYNAAGRAVLDGIFHQIAYRLPEQLCISGQGTGRGIHQNGDAPRFRLGGGLVRGAPDQLAGGEPLSAGCPLQIGQLKSSLTMADKRSTSPLDDLEQLQCGLGGGSPAFCGTGRFGSLGLPAVCGIHGPRCGRSSSA